MSLTGPDDLFAAVHEHGANAFITAFFKARPRLLNYGSDAFIPATTVTGTHVSPIDFPGTGSIQWGVAFDVPTVDFYPASTALPAPLAVGVDQLALHTRARLEVLCGNAQKERHLQTAVLDVWAVGHVNVVNVGGTGTITFAVDAVQLPDVQPKELQGLLDCLIAMMVNALIASFNIPFHAFTAGAFNLVLTRGPSLDTDQAKVWGHL